MSRRGAAAVVKDAYIDSVLAILLELEATMATPTIAVTPLCAVRSWNEPFELQA